MVNIVVQREVVWRVADFVMPAKKEYPESSLVVAQAGQLRKKYIM